MEIAKEIIEQLGGNKFRVMTRAVRFVALSNGVQFQLPGRFAKDGINWVKIVLNGLDLYDIEYGIKRKAEIVIKATSTNIYCDMLQEDFEANTGLYTQLY